jgi:hypothetical protein
MDENQQKAERAMARVQNTQRIQMEDNKKNTEDDLRMQRVELASAQREMNANKIQWQQAFAELQKQLEVKLKEVTKVIRPSIGTLAK